MLALNKLGKTYPNGVHALEQFSAEINLGEIVGIIGGSGCGKSTLLRAVSGLEPATSGTVTLDDAAIRAPHPKIGIIFQEPRLLPWLSVAENIGFGLSDLPTDEKRERIARALVRVGLADKAKACPPDSSRGQALALSARPTRTRARAIRSRFSSIGKSERPKPIFSATDSHGKSRGSWKMMPIFGCGARIAASSRVTVPEVAGSRPETARRSVDLPQPEPPMMATISPWPISAEKRSSACTPLG